MAIIIGLATNAALTAVETKIPNISSLVKKTDYNTRITEIEKKPTDDNNDKCINTPEFNKFTAEVLDARLARENWYFKRVAGFGSGNYIYFWKSKGLFDEKLQLLL